MSDKSASVAVVAVGDELTNGDRVDTNSSAIARALAALGRRVEQCVVIGDDEEGIAQVLTRVAAQHPIVVVTGGLGPTLDDVTRHAVARAAGVAVELSQVAWDMVTAWYERLGRAIPESNRRQALIPEGARVLANEWGTAPGFHLRIGTAEVFALPGPPREMLPMLERHITSWLVEHPVSTECFAVRRFYLFGLSESVFADRVGAWMQRGANPLLGVTASQGVLAVRLIARGQTADEVEALLAERGRELLEVCGDYLFSEEEPDLDLALGRLLVERELSITTAESCTGGLVAARLTRAPGISAVFREGFVTYSNAAKTGQLGVPTELLEAHGAVSSQVAAAMACGAAERTGASLAVSVTGVAGPGGGSSDKPVGLVWFGLAQGATVTTVERRWPDAGRDRIREWASGMALDLVLRAVQGRCGGHSSGR